MRTKKSRRVPNIGTSGSTQTEAAEQDYAKCGCSTRNCPKSLDRLRLESQESTKRGKGALFWPLRAQKYYGRSSLRLLFGQFLTAVFIIIGPIERGRRRLSSRRGATRLLLSASTINILATFSRVSIYDAHCERYENRNVIGTFSQLADVGMASTFSPLANISVR